MSDKRLPGKSGNTEVDLFLNKVALAAHKGGAGGRGRLIFAMDATASREPVWDRACHIQGQMFESTNLLGGLDIQLCYYHGFEVFQATRWCRNPSELRRQMTTVCCLAGYTQIGRVLRHAVTETKKKKVNALVFIGDCMEEDPGQLSRLAGELGLLGLPVFVFQEGYEPIAEDTFRNIAKLSNGAYCHFDTGSAQQLRDLLGAVAVYAAGGRTALENYASRSGNTVLQLTKQMKRG